MMTYNHQKWVRARWGHTVEGVYPHLVEQPAEECFDQRRPPASEAADFVPFTAMVGRFADAVLAAAAASFAMPPEPPPEGPQKGQKSKALQEFYQALKCSPPKSVPASLSCQP